MNSPRFSADETIAALASAPGGALRGIVRISGREAVPVLRKFLGRTVEFHPRQARRYLVDVPLKETDLTVPVQVHLWPTSRSFTGEPLAELHLAGSPPLLNELLERAFLSGARPAQAGEFTLRAFLAGRIDLVQAEAVLGVIDATSEQELQTALGQLAGGISTRIGEIRERLLLHLADLEAGLDFVEEDIEFIERDELLRRLNEADRFLADLLSQSRTRMQSTGRARVVLAGLPNAGKSTLFNRLAGREAALVSTVAGTTRDYLSTTLHWQGIAWELIDTAGWETARNRIESATGRLRDEQYRRAQLIVWCTPADLAPVEAARNAQLLEECRALSGPILEIQTKADDRKGKLATVAAKLSVSATTGEGIESLLDAIVLRLSGDASASEVLSSTAARCAESLQHALEGIGRARELVEIGAGDELISMELRDVLGHLGRIVGAVYTDDILDRIFSRFCIGK